VLQSHDHVVSASEFFLQPCYPRIPLELVWHRSRNDPPQPNSPRLVPFRGHSGTLAQASNLPHENTALALEDCE